MISDFQMNSSTAFSPQIKVDDEGKIVDAKFKTFGCGSAIASSSLATEWIKGRKVTECITWISLNPFGFL